MRSGLVSGVVLGILCWATAARARDWKDGCPPYVHLPDRERQPRAADFGTSADIDAALGPSRLALTTRLSGLSGRNSDGNLIAGRGVLALNFAGPSLMFVYTYGGRDGSPATSGTLMTYIGFRHVAFLLGDALRFGASLRVGVGASPTISVTADGTSRDGERSEALAKLSPFESEGFAFDRPVAVSLETRLELVGCYAPFVALRADTIEWREGFGMPRDQNPSLWALPVRLAMGGYVSKPGSFPTQLSIAVEAGFEWRSRDLGYGRTGRLRILAELPLWKARIAVYASGFAGDAKGAEAGALLSMGFDSRGVLQ